MATTPIRNPAQQSLPNECLLYVLGYLRHDLFELYTLLTVNRFCYHAVLPWMLDDALERWQMNMCDCEWAVDREKLMVLYLVSVLQYSGPAAKLLLELCGLELIQPPSPKYQLLTEYMAGGSRLTVDYSKYQTQFAPVYMSWNYIDLNSFIRLKTLPEEWEGTIPPPPMILGPVDWEYKEQLRTALVLFFATHNPEPITVLTLHLASIHKFIPLANRFSNLRTLRLSMDESVPDRQIQNLLAFLQSHQKTFPRKCRLALQFYDRPHIDDDMPSQERRSLLFARARPMLLSIQTQERPSTLDVSSIPRFYDHCDEISTLDLRHFVDEDEERNLIEGYAAQTRFLERCNELESMEFVLRDAHLFAWAADRITKGGRRPLPNLRKLNFKFDGTARQMIRALEDIALVWGGTLENVGCSWRFSSSAIEQDQTLARLPDSTKLGTWNFPALRTMVLMVNLNSSLEFGTFSGCPALETLEIHMKRNRSSMTDTATTEPLQDQPFQPMALEFPCWALPNLRELELTGYAALLFNYASLGSMKRLSRLCLITEKSILKDVKDKLTARMRLYMDQTFDHRELPVDPQALIWLDGTLSSLRHVQLEGFAAEIIPFEWLLRCPVLEKLRILWVSRQRNLLSRPDLLDKEAMNYQSQLDVLDLHGPWTASADDLVWILTHHANQLSQLTLSQGDIKKSKKLESADMFFCVRQADDINQKAFESNPARWSRAPGSRLVAVNLSLYSNIAKVQALGLQVIDKSENIWRIRQRRERLRIYSIGSIHAIHTP
ncbi:hypothetical protein EC968_006882 [Mortierella alpina]|nr:hypothetical protein EC968_006882 [Mortierella alpina]